MQGAYWINSSKTNGSCTDKDQVTQFRAGDGKPAIVDSLDKLKDLWRAAVEDGKSITLTLQVPSIFQQK